MSCYTATIVNSNRKRHLYVTESNRWYWTYNLSAHKGGLLAGPISAHAIVNLDRKGAICNIIWSRSLYLYVEFK
jgi:hypothetical protein